MAQQYQTIYLNEDSGVRKIGMKHASGKFKLLKNGYFMNRSSELTNKCFVCSMQIAKKSVHGYK